MATSSESLYRKLVSQLTNQSSKSGTVSSNLFSSIGRDNEVASLSLGERSTAQGIHFGSPSQPSATVSSSQSSTDWTKLLQRTATGGIANAFGSVRSLGLGSIVSGILGLFQGGTTTLPPLTTFELPASQDRTISIGNSNGTSQAGIYASPDVNTQWFLDRSNDIAQAVKQAMLHSSSINDVISEI